MMKFLTLPTLLLAFSISFLNACKNKHDSAIAGFNNNSVIELSAAGEVTRPDSNQSTGFFTLNGKVYDANGNEFIARGINNTHYWWDKTWANTPALEALDNIAGFGFNSVRIVWGVISTNDQILEAIIDRTIESNMVPMVSLHDFTGSNDTNDLLNRGVKWWTDRADIWQKYEESLMINIANEFGDWAFAQGSNRAEFPKVYKEAITRIRNAGINNTLIIDSFHYGKDYSLIAEYGREIYEHDPQQNVVFSIHFYCGEGEDQAEITKAFDSITGKGLPMMVGEFGHSDPACNIQEEFIMAESEAHDVGYYAWAWDDPLHPIASNAPKNPNWEADSPDELTPSGYNIIFGPNGINATSKIASIFDDSLTIKLKQTDGTKP